jgi:peptidase E
MHISLFRLGSKPIPLRETLLEQDIVYVGGGSMLGLLAVWRALGLDLILREAWESGVILAGLSAGAMCWFEWGITKSLGHPAPSPGLGFLPGSMSVHMDGEPTRLPICRAAIADGTIGPGYAADDGVALLFSGTVLTEVVSSRPNRRALRIGPDGEEPLEPRLLAVADRYGPTPEIAEFRRVRALRPASPPVSTGGSSRPARAAAGRAPRGERGSPPSRGSATSRPRPRPPGAGRP